MFYNFFNVITNFSFFLFVVFATNLQAVVIQDPKVNALHQAAIQNDNNVALRDLINQQLPLSTVTSDASQNIVDKFKKYFQQSPEILEYRGVLQSTILNSDIDAFRLFLDYGVDIGLGKTYYGNRLFSNTVMQMAIDHAEPDYLSAILQRLKQLRMTMDDVISHFAKSESKNADLWGWPNMPALHYAVSKNKIDIVLEILRRYPEQLMMDAYPEVRFLNIRNPWIEKQANPAYTRLINSNIPEIGSVIREANALEIAVKNNRIEIAELFLKMGVDPNRIYVESSNFNEAYYSGTYDNPFTYIPPDREGDWYPSPSGKNIYLSARLVTPLWQATQNNNVEMINLLLIYGANPDICPQSFWVHFINDWDRDATLHDWKLSKECE